MLRRRVTGRYSGVETIPGDETDWEGFGRPSRPGAYDTGWGWFLGYLARVFPVLTFAAILYMLILANRKAAAGDETHVTSSVEYMKDRLPGLAKEEWCVAILDAGVALNSSSSDHIGTAVRYMDRSGVLSAVWFLNSPGGAVPEVGWVESIENSFVFASPRDPHLHPESRRSFVSSQAMGLDFMLAGWTHNSTSSTDPRLKVVRSSNTVFIAAAQADIPVSSALTSADPFLYESTILVYTGDDEIAVIGSFSYPIFVVSSPVHPPLAGGDRDEADWEIDAPPPQHDTDRGVHSKHGAIICVCSSFKHVWGRKIPHANYFMLSADGRLIGYRHSHDES